MVTLPTFHLLKPSVYQRFPQFFYLFHTWQCHPRSLGHMYPLNPYSTYPHTWPETLLNFDLLRPYPVSPYPPPFPTSSSSVYKSPQQTHPATLRTWSRSIALRQFNQLLVGLKECSDIRWRWFWWLSVRVC